MAANKDGGYGVEHCCAPFQYGPGLSLFGMARLAGKRVEEQTLHSARLAILAAVRLWPKQSSGQQAGRARDIWLVYKEQALTSQGGEKPT